MSLDFAAVLTKMVETRASDVHLTAGFPPAVRVRGRIVPMDDYPPLSPQETREIVYSASEGLPTEHAHHELRYSAPLYVLPRFDCCSPHPLDVGARYAGPA